MSLTCGHVFTCTAVTHVSADCVCVNKQPLVDVHIVITDPRFSSPSWCDYADNLLTLLHAAHVHAHCSLWTALRTALLNLHAPTSLALTVATLNLYLYQLLSTLKMFYWKTVKVDLCTSCIARKGVQLITSHFKQYAPSALNELSI